MVAYFISIDDGWIAISFIDCTRSYAMYREICENFELIQYKMALILLIYLFC